MIIGKGGSFIKLLKDESGAFIQISQKSKDATLSERVVTIIGEKNANRKAMEMILSKIQEDPQSASCLNISYGDVQGLVANPNPTGSPFATVAMASGPNYTVRAQSFTSLMADLHQDIKRVSSFSRCLNGIFPRRNCSVKTLVH